MCPRNAVKLDVNPQWNDFPDLTEQFSAPERTVKTYVIRLTQTDIDNLNAIRSGLKCTNYSIALRSALENTASYYRNRRK